MMLRWSALIVAWLALPTAVWSQYPDDDVVIVPEDSIGPGVPAPPLSLDERCTVSVLNRTARVQSDGTFIVNGVPTNFGAVRARATCLVDGTTVTGQSQPFLVPPNGTVDTGVITFDVAVPIPTQLAVTATPSILTALGAASQLAVTATFSDSSTSEVTTDPSTSYVSSNPAIATVDGDGRVTAVAGGPVLVTVLHDGVSGFVRVVVDVPTTDTDGDGIPDGVETANGLDPDDPLDGFADPDGDGLTNKEELVDYGTDPAAADTDGDGLSDGDEVRTRGTNPLVADTDGDGVRDGLEVQTGSNPLDAASVNLPAALTRVDVTPVQFVLTVNTIIGEASVQLAVTGTLRDGTTIDLTAPARGTSYVSSDLTVCTFGTPAGRVFAGVNGTCTVTVTSNGFAVPVPGRVQSFAPRTLGFVAIPGFANNLDVSGDVAYVASGSTGLRIVSLADRSAPAIIGSLDTAGNGNDVRVAGTTGYVADGTNGLVVVDVTNPAAPVLRGTADTPGDAYDVVVRGTTAFVADGSSGLQIVDMANAGAPAIVGAVDTPGTAKGVDLVAGQPLAVIADGTNGVVVVDVSDPAAPAIVGSVSTTGDARDLTVQGAFAFVADGERGFTSVEVADPAHPVVRATLPSSQAGRLMDTAVMGRFAAGADFVFVNAVPIVDVAVPASPVVRTTLDFATFRDDNGTGIALDARYLYLTGDLTTFAENGVSGDSRLYVGEYLAPVDTAGTAPLVQIASPASSASVIEQDSLPITVSATDDVAVTSVDIFAAGTLVRTATAPPYQHSITVPTGVSTLTLGARAIDYGNNVGTAPAVTVNVIPDPGTTVTGRTVNPSAVPLAGATVTCFGVSGMSEANGTFTIPNVPTIRGNVQCSATALDSRGRTLTGSVTGGAPVRGGTTPVGDIVLALRVSFTASAANPQASPIAIDTGDFNEDGALDLVTAIDLSPAGVVSVLIGNGDGTFRPANLIAIGPSGTRGSADVKVGDLNHDGHTDIVAAAFTQSVAFASVLLGRGDGMFLPVQTFPAGGGFKIALGDLNGDGHLDLVQQADNHLMAVVLGNGDGTFAARQLVATGNGTTNTPVLGDVDNNGTLDVALLTPEFPSSVYVHRGNGDGTLQAPFTVNTAGGKTIALADLDRDGDLDLVVSEFENQPGSVSVLLGIGDGTFGARTAFPVPTVTALAVGDVNGDAFPDVVTGSVSTLLVQVLLGEGNGTLLPAQAFFPNPAGVNAIMIQGVAIGRVNADALPDVMAVGNNTSAVGILTQQ